MNPVVDGQDIDFVGSWVNGSDIVQRNVVIRADLPQGLTLVPDTSFVLNANNRNGPHVTDAVATPSGIDVGSYTPKSNVLIAFQAHFQASAALSCGTHNVGVFFERVNPSGPRLRQVVVLTYVKPC